MPDRVTHKRSPEHQEAVRLFWKSLHIPVGSLLVGTLAAAGILSAVLSMMSE